ncbi:2,3-dihydro-2,3-dihydroxybenzoate dehydrogenase [Plantactinospora sp. ZYX-F-223]|uniref:2,3-dihydro-2,3-dihydroxybenzoate dehydrogenase n=1 Tax=Plantactinospora sp. ZYX-F-223 TaxID=3144103 RepID=UPI0031FDF65B
MVSYDMAGRVAVVTGAAGGIGAELVRALARQGASVAAVDNDAERLRAVTATIRAAGTVLAFPGDVTSSIAAEGLTGAVEGRLGPIDFLVNGAGVLHTGEARTLTDLAWATTFAVNTTGVFNVSRAVVNRMVPRRRGAIVTVASNAAGTPRVGMAAYAASKAAATMFTKTLGLEVARYGIRCNVVAPGSTDTPMLSKLWTDGNGRRQTIEGTPDVFRLGIPLGKLGQPSDVASAVLFLLSDQSGHITMHDLTVDGGATLGV